MSVSDNGPGMSGLDVAREVRAIRKELPIAITSGFIDEDLRVEATRVGAIELISKPFMTQDFFAIVKRLASGEESRSIKFVQERTRYEVDAD